MSSPPAAFLEFIDINEAFRCQQWNFRVESSRPTASGKIENRRVGRIESGGREGRLSPTLDYRCADGRRCGGRRADRNRVFPLIRGKFADTDNRLIAAAMETYHVPTKLGWRNSAPVKSTGRSIENEKDPARNSTNVPRPLFILRENFKNLRSLKISFRWRV